MDGAAAAVSVVVVELFVVFSLPEVAFAADVEEEGGLKALLLLLLFPAAAFLVRSSRFLISAL